MTDQKVYILLTDTGTLLGKVISLYTKKAYNHASISFDRNLREVYSFGRLKEDNPFIGGFVRENMEHNMFKQANCRIYSFSVPSHKIHRMKQFIRKIEREKQRYTYNLLGLIAIIFDMPIKRDYAFFCSQFVASVLIEGGVVQFPKPVSLITPYDLLEISNLELVYEGKLANYCENNVVESNPFMVSI